MTQLHFHSILSDSSDDETVGGMKSSQRGSNLGHSMTGGMVRGGFYANTSSYSAATGTKIHSNGANLQQQHNFNRSHSLKQRLVAGFNLLLERPLKEAICARFKYRVPF